jgi:protein O-mannosyl-transferase
VGQDSRREWAFSQIVRALGKRVNSVDIATQTTTSDRRHSQRLIVGVCVFLVALAWLVFGQTLRHQFVNYDDGSYVYGNPNIAQGLSVRGVAWAFTHVHSQNWHPLTTISHMLDCQLFGLKSGGHHFTNVFLHTVAVLLLFLVLRGMTGSIWRSAFVAAVFAIHPLRVESVAWIAERKDLLSGVFFMLTLGAYARYASTPSFARYLTMSILFACGLMSKPMLVTTPFVLLLLDYWPLRRIVDLRSFRRMLIEKIPLLLLSAASCVATILAQKQATGSAEELPLLWRVNNAIVTCVTYIWQMFWPARLSVFYPHPENRLSILQVFGAAILLIAISFLAIILRRKRPYLLTGWFWYLIMLVPVIGVFQVGMQGHADRYTYLPHIGLYLLVTWSVAEMSTFRGHKEILFSVSCIFLVGLSLCAWRQTTHWKNSETLWRHALVINPNDDVAQAGLGGVLLDNGKLDEAIAHFQRALAIRSANAQAHRSLGNAFIKKGNTSDAIAHWHMSLELQPEDVEARDDLGAVLAQQGRLREAMAEWRKSLQYNPDDVNALNNLAWVLAAAPESSLRDGVKAVEFAQRALQLSGKTNPMVLRTLAAAYAETGRFADAIEAAKIGLQLAIEQKNVGVRDELESNIKLYQAGSPYRDAGLRSSAELP